MLIKIQYMFSLNSKLQMSPDPLQSHTPTVE